MPISAHLTEFLKIANRHPQAGRHVLQGSLLMHLLCPGTRNPDDVDYLVLGDFDPIAAHAIAKEIEGCAESDEDLKLIGAEVIYDYTDFPGLRSYFRLKRHSREKLLKVDFSYGDPLFESPMQLDITNAGLTWCIALETLYAWKLHALVQWGSAHWRAKDLYDLDVMWASGKLRSEALLQAIPIAFHSRKMNYWDLRNSFLDYKWGYYPTDIHRWDEFCTEYDITARYTDVRLRLIANLSRLPVGWHDDDGPLIGDA
jgi:hypothetical protein